ncbi:hypothetical protein HMPREF0662_00707 [Prevotella nigrescens F0103]|nr:hypothetical protein HMPREF0662_00707 [Prevotella nigrescens F0103]
MIIAKKVCTFAAETNRIGWIVAKSFICILKEKKK